MDERTGPPFPGGEKGDTGSEQRPSDSQRDETLLDQTRQQLEATLNAASASSVVDLLAAGLPGLLLQQQTHSAHPVLPPALPPAAPQLNDVAAMLIAVLLAGQHTAHVTPPPAPPTAPVISPAQQQQTDLQGALLGLVQALLTSSSPVQAPVPSVPFALNIPPAPAPIVQQQRQPVYRDLQTIQQTDPSQLLAAALIAGNVHNFNMTASSANASPEQNFAAQLSSSTTSAAEASNDNGASTSDPGQQLATTSDSEAAAAAAVRVGKRTYRHESFPEKVHRMLEETEENNRDDIVSYTADGRAFEIHQPEVFEPEILGHYFRHSRLTSFRRQLSMYGFARVRDGPDAGAYMHELFVRGRPELCKNMVRANELGGSSTQQASEAKKKAASRKPN